MSTREAHVDALRRLSASPEEMTRYLVANSNLPGPRANLELAHAFGDVVGGLSGPDARRIWRLCLGYCKIPEKEAPSNSPREFLPFCGAIGLGSLGCAVPALYRDSIAELRTLAHDGRWRTREAVATALQRMMARSPGLMEALGDWVADEDWLLMRAVAAGVAEPPLLRDPALASTALGLHRRILARLVLATARDSPEFKTLRQALGFTLSVVAAALGDEGVGYLRELATSKDADVLWVVRENLKKDRMRRRHPKEVEAIERLLSERASYRKKNPKALDDTE